MAKKVSSPALEAKEEKLHKDLDGDGEKGESVAHQKKVLGPPQAAAKPSIKAGSKAVPPPFPPKKGASQGTPAPFVKKASKGKNAAGKSSSKMCGPCTKGKMSSCSHL